MDSKIVTHGFDDQIVRNTVHTMHFRDLYLGYFYDKIEEEKVKDDSEDVFKEFNEMYCNWALEEILKIGLVTIYHFWERCIKGLINEQSKFLKIQLTVKHHRKSMVRYCRESLETDFSCVVDGKIWDLLDEARKVVNTYKHGDHESFKLIKDEYPYYFESFVPENDSDLSEFFFLGKNNFERLTNNIVNFWEKVPHTPKFS